VTATESVVLPPVNRVSVMTTSQVEPMLNSAIAAEPNSPFTALLVGVVVEPGGAKQLTFRKTFVEFSDPMLSETTTGWLLGLLAPK